VKSAIFDAWAWLFARASFEKLNRFLFLASLRGLGILNFRSLRDSGERNFLESVLAVYAGDGVANCVVLDVGANVGNYAREVLSISRDVTIHCFEPHPANLAKLRDSVQSLGVQVVASAVGSSEGTMELFDYSDADGSSHASVYKEVFEKIHGRSHVSHGVEVVTLDAYVQRVGIEHVMLLKIDTEGHELAALVGAEKALRDGRIDVVQFEFNEMNIASRTFLGDFFAVLPNYRLYRLLADGWIPLRDRPIENIFAYQNIVAVRNGSRAEAVFAGRSRLRRASHRDPTGRMTTTPSRS
jgi:FkbM family methyltransferase